MEDDGTMSRRCDEAEEEERREAKRDDTLRPPASVERGGRGGYKRACEVLIRIIISLMCNADLL